MSTEEAVLLDDVPRTFAHVENDLSRDGLVDADAGEASREALCCEAVGAVGTFEVALQSSNVDLVELLGAGVVLVVGGRRWRCHR